MTWSEHGPVTIVRCCRDWPVFTLARMGKCGFCGERPEPTDKTVDEYMAERETAS